MGLSGSPDPTPSLLRARMIALKALEVDPEHPEALDILMLIDEQFGQDMEDLRIPTDPVELPHEVRIVRRTSPGTAELETSEMVITLESDAATEVGAFTRNSTGIFETATDIGQQLQAAWAGWATEGNHAASVPPARKNPGGATAQAGWAYPGGHTPPRRGVHGVPPTTWRHGKPWSFCTLRRGTTTSSWR